MKQYLLIIALLASICVSAQVKSGFVIGYSPSIKSSAGAGVLWDDGKKPDVSDLEWKYLYGLNLGYQFQIPLSKSFFLDASVLGKMQMGSLKSGFGINNKEYYRSAWSQKKAIWGTALNATINYRIWKGLSIGLGIEPTVLFNTTKLRYNDADKTAFDFPVLVKVGYELKNIGFAVSYKQGFKALYDNYMLNSEKNKELQISVFVPIFK